MGVLRKQKFKFFSVFLFLLLLLGCLFVLTGENYFAFASSLVLPILVILNVITAIVFLFKKETFFLFPVFGILVFFFCFDSFLQWSFESNKNDVDSLSLLTYNAQGFMSQINEKKIASFIEMKAPDIILFQEFAAVKYKYFEKDYPYWLKTNIKYPSKSVLAVFSKYPIIETEMIELPNTRNNAIYVDVLYNEEIIRIYNLHLESFGVRLSSSLYSENKISSFLSRISKSQKKRIEQVAILEKHMTDFNGKIIICGDFNCTPYSSTYHRLKKDKNDSFIEKGNGLGVTYNLYGYPLRLDYILVDQNIEVMLHENFKLEYSDHEPVLVELNLAK